MKTWSTDEQAFIADVSRYIANCERGSKECREDYRSALLGCAFGARHVLHVFANRFGSTQGEAA